MSFAVDGIDSEAVLTRLQHNKALFQRLQRSFYQQLQHASQSIPELLVSADAEAMQFLLHKLKGSAANMEANALHHTLGLLEQALKEGQSLNALAFDPLLQQMDELLHQLEVLASNEGEAIVAEAIVGVDLPALLPLLQSVKQCLSDDDYGQAMRQVQSLPDDQRFSPMRDDLNTLLDLFYEFDPDESLEATERLVQKVRALFPE